MRLAEVRFAIQRAMLESIVHSSRLGSRVEEPTAYHAEGVLYRHRRSGKNYVPTQERGNDKSPDLCATRRLPTHGTLTFGMPNPRQRPSILHSTLLS